jgi:hypothetical protein
MPLTSKNSGQITYDSFRMSVGVFFVLRLMADDPQQSIFWGMAQPPTSSSFYLPDPSSGDSGLSG